MTETTETSKPHIVATDAAVGILPVEGRTPITVIGTDSIRAGFDARCLQQAVNSPHGAGRDANWCSIPMPMPATARPWAA